MNRGLLVVCVLCASLAAGCASSRGGTAMSAGQVNINVSEKVLNDPAKAKELQDRQLVETLHRYLSHRFTKLALRPTLITNVEIVSLRLRTSVMSPGADHIGVAVTVEEAGQVLKAFSLVSYTQQSAMRDRIPAMSKDLAKRIYEQVKDIEPASSRSS